MTKPGPFRLAALATAAIGWMSIALAQERELPVKEVPNLGEAAELYFSPDGKRLIGTAKRDGDAAHMVYVASLDGREIRRINDRGEDACSYFFPDGRRIVWTSTRDNLEMPKGNWSDPRDYPQGAELYSSNADGTDAKRLTSNRFYDAEVSVSPDGKWLLFTRQIDGKLDLWRMRPDGTGETQITRTDEWQEGGSFYMPDSETILLRAWKRADEARRGRPMTIFTIRHDGTELEPITTDPDMNWAPYPAPDGRHFVYVRMLPPQNFEVFLFDMKTKQKRRLTSFPGFDGFPALSPDGRKMAFASSRDAKPGERMLKTYLMDVSSLGLGAK